MTAIEALLHAEAAGKNANVMYVATISFLYGVATTLVAIALARFLSRCLRLRSAESIAAPDVEASPLDAPSRPPPPPTDSQPRSPSSA